MTDNQRALIEALPSDWQDARFLGRVDFGDGPTPVLIDGGIVHDMAAVAPTVSALVESGQLDATAGRAVGDLADLAIGATSPAGASPTRKATS